MDILAALKRKAALVEWRKGERKESYVIFSRSGFTKELVRAAGKERPLCAETPSKRGRSPPAASRRQLTGAIHGSDS
jgi:hypothetical protein